jgi:hypothetical protein
VDASIQGLSLFAEISLKIEKKTKENLLVDNIHKNTHLILTGTTEW